MRICKIVWTLLLAVLFVLTGAGCSSSVIIEDSSAQMPAFKVSREVGERVAVQLEASRIRADGSSNKDFSEKDINIGRIAISNPLDLAGDYTLEQLSLSLAMQPLDRPRMGLRTLVGVRRTALDLTLVDDQNNRYSYRGVSQGPGAELELIFPFGGNVSGVIHTGWDVYLAGDLGTQVKGGVRLAYNPQQNIELFAGWFESFYRNREHRSDIKLRSSGFALGVHLQF